MCHKCKKNTKEVWFVGHYGWLKDYIDETKEYCTKCFTILENKAIKKRERDGKAKRRTN